MAAFPLEYISNLFNTDYILILHQSTILNQKTPFTYSSFSSPCSLLSSLYSLESWYTAPRAPLVSLGATVSGNCFDHYRSMPDGNQIGLFCCQTPRFRKEAPLPAGNGKGDGVIDSISFNLTSLKSLISLISLTSRSSAC